MIQPTIINFLLFCSIAWGTNISLNFLYIIKRDIPKTGHLDSPIDGGLKYKGEPLIGESTTVVGLVLCLILSIILYFIVSNFTWAVIPILVYFGHLLGSFIKRRMRKKNGESVSYIDRADYMVLIGFIYVSLGLITLNFAVLSILITYIFHPIICYLAYKFKLREYPY